MNVQILEDLGCFIENDRFNQEDMKYFEFKNIIYDSAKFLTIRALYEAGVLRHSVYLDSDGLNKTFNKKKKIGNVLVHPGDCIQLYPIEIRAHAHKPIIAKSEPNCSYIEESFQLSVRQKKYEFSFFKPCRVKVCFLIDLEFNIEKYCKVRPWVNAVTFGIYQQVSNNSKLSSWNFSKKLEATIITNSDSLYCLEKLDLNISEKTAEDFLQADAYFINLKKKIKSHDEEEIKRLEGCQWAYEDLVENDIDTNSEIDSLIQFLQMIESFQIELNQNFSTVPIVASNALSHRELLDYLNVLRQFDQGGREALIKITQLKSELVRNNPTYVQLVKSGNENMLQGIAFEELMASKIIECAKQNGIKLVRYEGDGIGVLPNGNKTPKHTDLVFMNEEGNFLSYQLKFSDSVENVKEMIKKFILKHRTSTNNSGYEQLDLKNSQILGPGGMKGKIEIENYGQVEYTDEVVLIDKIKVKTPSLDEMKEFLEKNYETMQKMNEKGIGNNIKAIQKSVQQFEKDLIKKELNLQNCSNSKGQESLNKQINELKTKLKEAKESLEKLDLEINKKLYTPNIRQVLKQCGVVCAVAAITAGVTCFIISFHQNWDQYKSGRITGLQMAKNVTLSTIKGSAVSSAIAVSTALVMEGTKFLASCSNSLLSLTGSILGDVIGPLIVIPALGYQTLTIINDCNNSNITPCERNKLLSRMGVTTALTLGASVAAASLVTGPIGLCIGVGACIVIGLGDYFLGDKIASLFFSEDENQVEIVIKKRLKTIENEVTRKAYAMFDLDEHCTDKELKEAFSSAALKYHPDKCDEDKKEENKKIFQAVSAAYTYLKEKRTNKNF